MAVKILNIEVSDRLIKVCCTIPKHRGSQVLNSFMFRTPEGCVIDGLVIRPEDLAETLREELNTHGLSAVKSVVFSVASAKIATREVRLPPMKDKLLAQAIATNAAEYFPVDLASYHVSHLLLERTTGADASCRLLVMAAPLSLLEGYYKLAEAAGLNIKAIDNSGNSQYQALRGLDVHETTMYVTVDCTSTFVSFMQDDRLLLQRTFAFGGDELVANYMSITGKKSHQYLESLNQLSVSSPDFVGTDFLEDSAIEGCLERLIGGVQRSADYFNSSRWETATQQVVLMGACSHLVGLKELVAAATGLNTIYIEDIPGVASLTNSIPDGFSYISCIGSGFSPVDLMPQQFSADGKSASKPETLTAGFIICGLFVFAAIAFSTLSLLSYWSTSAEIDRTNTEIESLKPAEEAFLTYLAYQQGEEALNLITAQTQQPNADLVAFYGELETKMPASIFLLSALCTNEGVSMNVTVASYEESASVIKQLRSFESISVVDVGSVVRVVNEAGVVRYEFSVNCVYGLNPYLNDINPYESQIAPAEVVDPAAPEAE